jgi:hypothetical protein
MEVQKSRILSMAEEMSCWETGISTKKKGTISGAEKPREK